MTLLTTLIGTLLFAVAGPVIGCLLAGLDRIISARMQGRVGPPLLQPYYDVRKLFEKERVSVNSVEGVYVACALLFALIAGGIVPIFCCGESLETREAGEHVAFVTAQIKAGLEGVEISSGDQLVIAYEPIWAIGTGKTATADDAQEVCGAIRATLVEIFGQEIADGIRVLYGGSAKPENIAGFLEKEDVDGALVGGASLKADSFAAMVEKAGE